MFCKNCGKETDDNSNFCPNCGAALNAKAIAPYAPYDKTDALYNMTGRKDKDMPVRGSLSILPLFGIAGVVLMVITLMITYYSYNMIDSLKKNLSQYYSQITDDSLVNRISSPIIDFFTGGSLTQKREDITKMEQDLVGGKDFMTAGLGCAALCVLAGLAGVLRNMKKPSKGRLLFIFASILAAAAPVLVVIACATLYLINTQLIITITASVLGFIMLVVESQRIKIFQITYFPKRPIRLKTKPVR